jgi:hypothetical protein
VASRPLHAPEAEQVLALVEFHDNFADCPFAICVGLADNATVGLAGGAAVGLAGGATVGLAGGATVGLAGGAAVGLAGDAAVGLAGDATVGVVGPAEVPTVVPALALVGTVAGPPHAINPAIAGIKSNGHLRLKYCIASSRCSLVGCLLLMRSHSRSNTEPIFFRMAPSR